MRTKPALRTELLSYLSFFAAAALLVGVATTAVAGPISSGEQFWLVMALVALEVGVFVVFGRYLVTRLVLRPLKHLMSTADQVADGDLNARAPDGETRDFATLAARLNRMTDHLRDAQSQLVRSEKLASVGRLAAGIAHEVGNPLGAVGTYVEVLRRRGADPEVIGGLTRELDRLDRIVRSLLDYARPQEEALELVQPSDIVRGAFTLLEAQGALKTVRPSLDLADGVPRIRARAHLLEQALVNIVLNAVDAAPGAAVVVGVRRWAYEPGHAAPRRAVDPRGRVLVVGGEPGLRQSLGLLLADAGYDVAAESDGKRALERALAEPFDLILSDVRMPEMDGLAFLRAYRSRGGTALVIMMSAYGAEEAALAAMKEGAYDYIPKPFRPDEVVLTLRKAEERERLGRTIATLKAQLDSTPAARALVAERRPMRAALEPLARVAEPKTTVLITGGSGAGEEGIAQAIHRASPRAAAQCFPMQRAAIP